MISIRDYLESKPDDFQYKINYVFVNWCPDGNVRDFRRQLDGSFTGFNHYRTYDFVYDDLQIGSIIVQLDEFSNGVIITITAFGYVRLCESCKTDRILLWGDSNG